MDLDVNDAISIVTPTKISFISILGKIIANDNRDNCTKPQGMHPLHLGNSTIHQANAQSENTYCKPL